MEKKRKLIRKPKGKEEAKGKKTKSRSKRLVVPMLLRRERKELKREKEKVEEEVEVPKFPKNPPWKPTPFRSEGFAPSEDLALQKIADTFSFGKSAEFFKGHDKSITCMDLVESPVIQAFTGSKDCSIIKWDIATGAQEIFKGERENIRIRGHFGEVLGIAAGEDGKFLVSGGADKIVRVWDVQNKRQVYYFEGHEDAITDVKVDIRHNIVYSISLDKTMKVWDMTKGECLDTLQGHTSPVLSMDTHGPKNVLTGGTDGRVFLWKLADETLLLYNSAGSTIDSIYSITPNHFVTACEDATIELWTNSKKKPLFSVPKSHASSFICSLAGVKGTDLFATGSTDNFVNLYKFDEEKGEVEIVDKLLVPGSINAIKFASKGEILVCAQSVDQRLGRWITRTSTPIGLAIYRNNSKQ